MGPEARNGGDEMTETHRGDGQPVAPAGRAPFGDGATCGIGTLPHRDASAAAAFAIGEFDVATVPTLPVGSSATAMIDQAVEGLAGVVRGPRRLEVAPSVSDSVPATELSGAAHAGIRAFLELAPKVRLDGTPVKWQFVGPVTLGVALVDGGMPVDDAFDLAVRLVRTRLTDLMLQVAEALPASPQLVLLDEPAIDRLLDHDFPLPPDAAIDLVSGAMAGIDAMATVGVHCCTRADLSSLLASGPAVVSLPADPGVVEWAGYLGRFLADGGVVAWGAIPTDGPVGGSADRHWRALSDLWCALVQLGCDPVRLRRQSLVTPSCGLAAHSVAVARRLARQTSDVAKRVKDQAGATRFALGA